MIPYTIFALLVVLLASLKQIISSVIPRTNSYFINTHKNKSAPNHTSCNIRLRIVVPRQKYLLFQFSAKIAKHYSTRQKQHAKVTLVMTKSMKTIHPSTRNYWLLRLLNLFRHDFQRKRWRMIKVIKLKTFLPIN